MVAGGMGDILYQTAEIAFNTETGKYFNPKTNAIYGSTPPAGGWEIPWYADSANKVVVPIGDAGVAKSEAQAAAIKNTTLIQLAAQTTNPSANAIVKANPAPTVNQVSNANGVSNNTSGQYYTYNSGLTNTSKTIDLAGKITDFKLPQEVKDNLPWILAAGAIGAYFMFGKK